MAYGKISKKQQEILDYIKDQIITRGFPPAVRDICEAVHLKSTSSVHSHLESLEKNGYIRRDPAKPRAIEIIDDAFNAARCENLINSSVSDIRNNSSVSTISLLPEMVEVPVIGSITAGQPILAVENIEGYFPIPAACLPNAQTYMLHVKGSSMINAGILNGDQIIVQKQNTARNGDKVVALIDDDYVTVKTFYKENGYYRLQPENDTMDPIIVKNVEILGKVIGLFRMM